jgi:hypothetical protein
MRLVKLKPLRVRRCGAYAEDFRHSIKALRLAAVVTVFVLLAAHPVTTLSTSSNSAAEPESPSASYSGAGGDYDCSAGGRLGRGKFPREGVKRGIEEAIKILEGCPACRKFYGNVEPINYLKHLVKSGKVIVSDRLPKTWLSIGPPSRWRIDDLKRWKNKEYIAVTVELLPKVDAKMRPVVDDAWEFKRPCIYINPDGFMITGAGFDGSLTKGMTLDQKRALVILHELAHAAGAIPKDGDTNQDVTRWKSTQNSVCVKSNCFPCAEHTSVCAPPPFTQPTPKPNGGNTVKSSSKERNRQ